jgi:hypothetical protein
VKTHSPTIEGTVRRNGGLHGAGRTQSPSGGDATQRPTETQSATVAPAPWNTEILGGTLRKCSIPTARPRMIHTAGSPK